MRAAKTKEKQQQQTPKKEEEIKKKLYRTVSICEINRVSVALLCHAVIENTIKQTQKRTNRNAETFTYF